VILGERAKGSECRWFYFAALLANAPQQSFPRGAEGAVSPAGVLDPRAALLSLQPPLQRVIDDPPCRIELGYEPI
jgi:hypothetical protein